MRIERGACSPGEAEQALAALDDGEGLYFGVDAGIAGLHPLQATLVTRPALRISVFEDGVGVRALTAFGRALFDSDVLRDWRSNLRRGGGASAIEQLRGFLHSFEASPDVLLLGALRFDAHRLTVIRARANDREELGVFYFPERMLRRDAHGQWRFVHLAIDGVDAGTDPAPAMNGHGAAAIHPGDDFPPGGYAQMVARALTILRERPLVSLTLSQSYRRRVSVPPSQAFARLRAANPAPASFFLNDGRGLRLFGASPDLQLVVSRGEVQALPVCGTVARRPGAQGEAESLRELFNEEVDAAALAVCSDALRNDLAPLCEPGSLRLLDRRRPMSLATVVHAVDRLAGRLRRGCDAWDAIAATAAPVMLTGTPRDEALRAIAELEASPRDWYGGMVVQVAADGDALVGTLLRAAAVRGDVAEVRTGGDLLADSSPEREEAESRLKTRSLWRAFGLEQAQAAHSTSPDSAPASVRLLAESDPFSAALIDTLAALGIRCADDARVCVLAGAAPPPAGLPVVAIGDSAYRLLATCGEVEPVPAEHGRVLHCRRDDTGERFTAARYATHRLLRAPAGWQIVASELNGDPVALFSPLAACLLYRPDSLLCDEVARQLLREAVTYFVARAAVNR
ncbi:chorismate-binding protein [Ramlibacter henchirensis]|nr:chorismate-binding protein [Ramlibacter henchirensis]